jgi:hypothetical protein
MTWSPPPLKLNPLILGEMAAFIICCMARPAVRTNLFSIVRAFFPPYNQQMCIKMHETSGISVRL